MFASEGQVLVSSTTDGQAAESAPKAASTPRRKSAGKKEGHVSQALKSVYQNAIDEDIPSEMLDLLSKLD